MAHFGARTILRARRLLPAVRRFSLASTTRESARWASSKPCMDTMRCSSAVPVGDEAKGTAALGAVMGILAGCAVTNATFTFCDGSSDKKPLAASEGGWWRSRAHRGQGRPPGKAADDAVVSVTKDSASKKEAIDPAVATNEPTGIRVALIGDSIMYGYDTSNQRTKVSMSDALSRIAAISGKKVDPIAVGSMCPMTITETHRMWDLVDMDTFLRGGNDPAGPHHGADIAAEAGYIPGTSPEPSMKKKLAIMANRFGVDLNWGWPWPDNENVTKPMEITPSTHLQTLLGESYTCRSFAVSGTTLTAKGHNPYIDRPQYREALEFVPEIVIISLGFNDANSFNWDLQKTSFIHDYLELIDSFADLESKPKIFICTPTLPTKVLSNYDEIITNRREKGGLDASMQAVANLRDVSLVDLEWCVDESSLEKDGAHPDQQGAMAIANTIYETIRLSQIGKSTSS